VATYAGPDAPAGSGSWVAYAKVCTSRPPSYWEAAACAKVAAAGYHSPPQALDAVLDRARRQIADWATLIDLDPCT